MKKAFILLLAVGLAIGIMAMVGCGSKTTTVKTPEGEVNVTEDGGEYSVETDEGQMTWTGSDEAPSEEELGAPIYPGADYVPGSGSSGSVSGEQGTFSGAYASFTTDDSFDKVVSWYKSELGSPLYEGVSGEEGAAWVINKGQTTTTVNVTSDGGQVSIEMGSTSGTTSAP